MNRKSFSPITIRIAQNTGKHGTVRAKVRRPEKEYDHEMKPAVFLDRDGTLMHEVNYCSHPDQVILVAGAKEALERLRQAGYLLIIVTNQSGIGRGLLSEDDFKAVQTEVYRQLGDGVIQQTYYCPDLPGSSSTRRKPSPKMVLEATREHGIDISHSWFIGDKDIDMVCGKRAGVGTILVKTGYGASEDTQSADHVADSIVEAVDIILG